MLLGESLDLRLHALRNMFCRPKPIQGDVSNLRIVRSRDDLRIHKPEKLAVFKA
jgi:hypothetical protein